MVKDISFIGKPHEYDARRVYSLTGADWQERVNFDRLRKDRLARAKGQMKIHDLGALVVYDGANVRYLTSSFQGNWKYNIFIRYAVLPREGEPILFETAGSDLVCAKMDLLGQQPRIAFTDEIEDAGSRLMSIEVKFHGSQPSVGRNRQFGT